MRGYLAALGLHKLEDAVGRVDLLETNEAIEFWKAHNLDFSAIFAEVGGASPLHCTHREPVSLADTLDEQLLIPQAEAALTNKQPVTITWYGQQRCPYRRDATFQ